MQRTMILGCTIFIFLLPNHGESINSTSGRVGDPCTTPTNQTGECRNLKNCSVLVELLQEDEPPSISIVKESTCGFEGLESLVCCPELDDRRSPWNNPRNRYTNTNRNPTVDGGSRPVGQGSGGNSIGQCGKSAVLFVGDRIVGGRPANQGEWPWMAALGYRSSTRTGLQWSCGGALVTNRHIITAAHCVPPAIPRSMTLSVARLGVLDLGSVDDGVSSMTVDVDQTVPHSSYTSSGKTDDIAIVRLRVAVQFNDNIRPICLPTTSFFRSGSLTGQKPFVIGWGALYFRGPKSNVLQQVDVAITEESTCRSAYSNQRGAIIDNRVLCADKPGADACQGDSGGPLMLEQGSTFYLIGVVSYGKDCANPQYPGVYTRVSNYLNWINSNLN